MRHVAAPAVLTGPIVVLALILSGSAVGAAGEAVQVALTAHRLATDADGKESLIAAEVAKPGEIIEYRARYSNVSEQAARQVNAILPIPAGTAYVPRTATPAPVQASLDGRSFAAVPLHRKVRLPDGRMVKREVPASEYRYLRWTFSELGPHRFQDVRARVRVSPAGPGQIPAANR